MSQEEKESNHMGEEEGEHVITLLAGNKLRKVYVVFVFNDCFIKTTIKYHYVKSVSFTVARLKNPFQASSIIKTSLESFARRSSFCSL